MEALVALTIVVFTIAAIANLTNTTLRSVVHSERNLAEVEIAQQLIANPPPRGTLASLSSKGQLDGHDWRIAAELYGATLLPAGATPRWVPAKLEISVRGPGGGWFGVEMIRLVRARAP